MTLREKQSRFALLVSHLIQYIYDQGYELTLGEAWRHPKTAEYLHSVGKGVKNSYHEQKLAIDLNLFKNGVYLSATEDHEQFGRYWESLDPNCTWGGDFKKRDGNHFSYGEK